MSFFYQSIVLLVEGYQGGHFVVKVVPSCKGCTCLYKDVLGRILLYMAVQGFIWLYKFVHCCKRLYMFVHDYTGLNMAVQSLILL